MIIIIKEDTSQANKGTPRVSLFSQPNKFALYINKTAFGTLQIKGIRLNRNANLAAVELCRQEGTERAVEKALQVTMIGNHKVTCYIPNRDKYKCGVISPIDTTADLQAILQEMQNKNEAKIIKLEGSSKELQIAIWNHHY